MVLAAPRKSQKYAGGGINAYGVVAGVNFFSGGLALLVGGFLRPARAGQGISALIQANDAADGIVVGLFNQTGAGGAANGDIVTEVEEGTFLFKNSAGADAITGALVGKHCFVIDDETVAATGGGGVRPRAGIVREVSADGVWVTLGLGVAIDAPRVVRLPFAINEVDTLAGTSAELVSPVKGRITKLSVIVQKAVTTGGDVTALVGITAVAGLACTIADGAAKGAIVEDTPTAGDASTLVSVGSRIQIAPAAAFNGAGAVSGFIEIAY